ncbi:hypothetical protein TrVFT333_001373 [Trichoderma virens FT-333]|nr:hypothetical protein TrVFT333_001373 [Trichoderma virens FT-333]
MATSILLYAITCTNSGRDTDKAWDAFAIAWIKMNDREGDRQRMDPDPTDSTHREAVHHPRGRPSHGTWMAFQGVSLRLLFTRSRMEKPIYAGHLILRHGELNFQSTNDEQISSRDTLNKDLDFVIYKDDKSHLYTLETQTASPRPRVDIVQRPVSH